MSARTQVWRFENFLEPGTAQNGYDGRFVPVTGHTTGDVDIHDIQVGPNGAPVFAVTRFNAIATLADRGSFKVLWKPPFIDKIAAEDRCHLNGVALDGNDLKYATCVGRSNVSDGWRDHRRDGGLLIDIPSGETVCGDLSMPHSPRIYQDKLWMMQSGTGEFGWVDPKAGRFEPLCFLPGFGRGMSFCGDYAIVGISLPRDNRSFTGLALNDRLEAEGATAKCGLCIINLKTGDLEHQLILDGLVKELYDVVSLPGLVRPMALGFQNDEISFTILPEVEHAATSRLN
ncbi:MAG: TIGR03032 family protein, partial [Paracoccaceae bacterium]